MKPDTRTPEEKARTKRINANVMIAVGAITSISALMGALILLSGRGDVPDWMFGGRSAARAATGDWSNASPRVAFEDWGSAATARAKKEGKLILLFLGPSFSAPTARMASETFGDPRVAALAAERFVPVRVRSDDFPDLDRRYRAGGWPTIALLLPDGVVLDAGTSMTPEVFLRWAGALAEKAASHPELVARAEAEAAAARAALARDRARTAPPMAASEAETRAQAALAPSWSPALRTFDARGPRFPRFERIAALSSLDAPWAKSLAVEASKGALRFQDPRDGGFFRAANPDGSPAALEKTASGQAAALDALCALQPDAARRELSFLEKEFTPKAADRWRGWQAGFALDEKRNIASDGPNFDRYRTEGWRETGESRLADDAELSLAVLHCAVSSPALKNRAKRVVVQAGTRFEKSARSGDPRLLLDDAVAVGPALLAAGNVNGALKVWNWMGTSLDGGTPFLDRTTTGILPPETDRIPDPALNLRALRFARSLAAALPSGKDKDAVAARALALYGWLSARTDSLDPAVWAAVASGRY